MASSPTAILALGLAALVLSGAGPAAAQTCRCAATDCCISAGFCGTSSDYCGQGCQSGPCTNVGDPVDSVVTEGFFEGIRSRPVDGCTGTGKSFYTRQSFLDAAQAYRDFGKGVTTDDGKRELAAFFAHVTHETGYMCYIEENGGAGKDYCDETKTEYPCTQGKEYFGRGPLQLTWNYNYGAAGAKLQFDGLGNPEKVAEDPALTFQAALWYWMNTVHIRVPDGFGATTRAINGDVECDGKRPDLVSARASYYQDYCQQFGVDPGSNLTC